MDAKQINKKKPHILSSYATKSLHLYLVPHSYRRIARNNLGQMPELPLV